jgi:hypothetical protein
MRHSVLRRMDLWLSQRAAATVVWTVAAMTVSARQQDARVTQAAIVCAVIRAANPVSVAPPDRVAPNSCQ